MSSTLVTPALISKPFGYAAANPTYITLPIPDPSQISGVINQASFHDGFPPATMTPEASGGLPFFGQDMNGILYMVSAYCANFAAGALQTYNSTLATAISGYPIGAIVPFVTKNLGLWISQVDGNSVNPDTSTDTSWYPLATIGAQHIAVAAGTVTATNSVAGAPLLVFDGTLTGNVNVVLPDWLGMRWVVVNNTTGAFTVTVKTPSGGGVVVPQTGFAAPTSIYCDGTNIQNTGVSTAGLAPIASPTFTGTPNAPTASPATANNAQIANTAFVQAAITAALAPYAVKASPVFSGAPSTPTAAPGTNNTQIANTAFVQQALNAAIPQVRGGTFTCVNGNVSVAFSPPFPNACNAVVCTGEYTGWDLGNVIPGTRTASGFQYHNANSGVIGYIAYGS
jgi:hypothetical protein